VVLDLVTEENVQERVGLGIVMGIWLAGEVCISVVLLLIAVVERSIVLVSDDAR